MIAPFPAGPVTLADLRRAASRFPSGVALVTAPGGDALVVNSFLPVSLEPLLIAFSPSRTSLNRRRMRRSGRFGVSVLGGRHGEGTRERARPGADRLAGLDVEVLADGVPVVSDALAALVCTLQSEHGAGDHTFVVGRVEAVHHGIDEPPLVVFGGEFGTVAKALR